MVFRENVCSAITFILAALVVADVETADDFGNRVIDGLSPAVQISGEKSVRWTLAERMSEYGVPGMAIAIIRDGHVVWTHEAGVLERGRQDKVNSGTRFRAQS